MKGKICKFWNNEFDMYIGELDLIDENASKYKYKMKGCMWFRYCELLTIDEFKQIQCKMFEK